MRKEENFNKPWFTSGLKKSSIVKNKLYKKFILSPTPLNLKEYKIYKNKYVHILRKAKKTYFSKKFEESKNNIKSTWITINQLLNKKKKPPLGPSLMLLNGNKLSNDPYEISCGFNNFFADVGASISQKIENISGSHLEYLKNLNRCIYHFEPPTLNEIRDVIRNLKTNSAGHDEISGFLMKEVLNNILEPLTHILSLSMATGVVPKDLKKAKIIPLFKDGDQCNFTNYRPISILPWFSKILEKLIYSRILSHLQDNEILFEHQYGFRKHHSTYMALLQLVDKIQTALNDRKYSLSIFLDLSKAFDTVNHEILFKKLQYYGFQGDTLKWLISYMKERVQYVVINGCASSTLGVSCGVPQGSVLGPLLFLIYMNDFPLACNSSSPILFADDTNMTLSHIDLHTLINNANEEMARVAKWFKLNKLSLNIKKSSFIVLTGRGRSYKKNYARVSIEGNEISQVCHVTFLGIIIDEKLNWKQHIDFIHKKTAKSLGIISKLRHFVDKSCLLTLYYSLIYPYLIYGNIVWANTFHSSLLKIYSLQKRFTRRTTFSNLTELEK